MEQVDFVVEGVVGIEEVVVFQIDVDFFVFVDFGVKVWIWQEVKQVDGVIGIGEEGWFVVGCMCV